MTATILRTVACGTAGILLATSPVFAAEFDGTWQGHILCQKLGITKGRLGVPLTMVVRGSKATFSRRVYNEDGGRVIGTEAGTGTVASDGAISLRSSWHNPDPAQQFAFTASYSGTASRGVASLNGTQVWSIKGNTENRSCSITLKH